MFKPTSICLLILGLTLTACNNGGTPAPVVPPLQTDFVQPTAIEGTVQVITVGNAATVRLRSSDNLETLSSAPVKSVGGQFSFSLPLPSAALTSKLKSGSMGELYQGFASSGDCTGTIQVSDLVAKIYPLSELQLVDGVKITKLSSITASVSGETNEFVINGWVYSLGNVTMTGTQTCIGTTNLANIHFKPGWNAIQLSSGKNGQSYQSVDPAKTVWRSL